MALDNCPDCGGILESKTIRLSNGDEVTLLTCNRHGYYCVYTQETDTVIVSSDHTCSRSLEKYYQKLPNRDQLVFDFCPECRFYALDSIFKSS
jgi:Zn-finger nucleic acid-binding protein